MAEPIIIETEKPILPRYAWAWELFAFGKGESLRDLKVKDGELTTQESAEILCAHEPKLALFLLP